MYEMIHSESVSKQGLGNFIARYVYVVGVMEHTTEL